MGDELAEFLKPLCAQEWAGRKTNQESWKAAEERHGGCAEDDERRRNGHEDEVLNHVRGEEVIVEGVDGGCEGDPEGKDAGQEGCGTPEWELVLAGLMNGAPSAEIEDQGDGES